MSSAARHPGREQDTAPEPPADSVLADPCATGAAKGVEYRPLFLDPADPHDAQVLADLRADTDIRCTDLRDLLRAEYHGLTEPFELTEDESADRWVYYPWRRSVLGLVGPQMLRGIRLDRNRNKITRAEQQAFADMTIAIVGQSVGHAVAYTLAQEGICGALRLADFDELELTNLNRIPTGLFDIGVNKCLVTARRIAELDPYLPVQVFAGGITAETVDDFLTGASLVVEECDALDMKVLVRQAARDQRIPVVMETSDRGLLDVERFDLEPERPVLHGLLGEVQPSQLQGLSAQDKAPYVVGLLEPPELSTRMAASLVESGRTLTSWPQLAGDVLHGAASIAAVVRRLGTGRPVSSGRLRIDVDGQLDELVEPSVVALAKDLPRPSVPPADETDELSLSDRVHKIVECARRAPSGGNCQPWVIHGTTERTTIALDPGRGGGMDIGLRASAVAVGAALYNARCAAAAHGMLGPSSLEETGAAGPLTAIVQHGIQADPDLAADYHLALQRETNRRLGFGGKIPDSILAELAAAADIEGAVSHVVTGRDELSEVARIMGDCYRIRHLVPRLQEEMSEELRYPGQDVSTGIDVRSLELNASERAGLHLSRRPDVMATLHEWSAGSRLGDYLHDRVLSSSALVAVSFPRPPEGIGELSAYAHAGAAVQRVWIHARRRGLAVQPMTPVFLFARHHAELVRLSTVYADRLWAHQEHLAKLLAVPDYETMALVLRLSYAAAASVRSLRRPVSGRETRR